MKIQKKNIFFFFWGGGGSGGGVGFGGYGECERRIEVFVKIQNKNIFFFFLGGGVGFGEGVRMDVNVELIFFYENSKKNLGGGSGRFGFWGSG